MRLIFRPRHKQALLICASLLASCATPGPVPSGPEGAPGGPVASSDRAFGMPTEAASARINGKVTPEPRSGAGPLIRQDGTGIIVAQPQPQSSVNEAGDVSLNYIDTDIKEIVRLILGNILKVNYTIDPGVGGPVTIQTPRPLRREELLPTLQGLLAQVGNELTYQGGVFRIGNLGDESVVPPVV